LRPTEDGRCLIFIVGKLELHVVHAPFRACTGRGSGLVRSRPRAGKEKPSDAKARNSCSE
jgi:hypothetical protein